MAWNKPLDRDAKSLAASKRQSSKNGARVKYGLLVLVVLVIAAIIYWFVTASNGQQKEEKRHEKSRPVEVNAKAVQTDSQKPVTAHKPTVPKQATPITLFSPTNSVGTNVAERLDRWGNPRHEARFKSVTEYCLALLFSTPLGKPPPPIPRIPEAELDKMEEILSRPTLVLKDDAESMKQMKRNCDLAKAEFRQFLADGGVDTEFFNYYRNKLMDKYRQWADGQKMVDDAYESGGAESAQETADKVNQLFRAKGIRDVVIPQEEN